MSISDSYSGKIEFRLIATIDRIHEVFMGVKDQKSVTCGPYSIMKIARSLGIETIGGLTEDMLAQMCGTVISTEEYELSRRLQDTNESDLDEETRQRFYPLELGVSGSEDLQGTSAIGVIDATSSVLGSEYVVHPLPAKNNGDVQFTESTFHELSDVLWENMAHEGLNAIFNVQVDLFCSNSKLKTPVDLFGSLSAEKCDKLDDWSVGHFIVLAGMIRRETANGHSYFYILQDSYKKRGMSGYLFQPEENLRNAMVRNDGNQGGLILVLPKAKGEGIVGNLPGSLVSSGWDNGTPYHKPGKLSGS